MIFTSPRHRHIAHQHNGSNYAVFSRSDAGGHRLGRRTDLAAADCICKLDTSSFMQAQAKDLSSRSTFSTVKAAAPRRAPQTVRTVTCSAQQSSKPVQTALAAAALAAAVSFGAVDAAQADISGLTPCAESKGFAKRQKAEVKTLTKRLKNVRV